MSLKKVAILCMVLLVLSGSAPALWAGEPEGARAADIIDLIVLRPAGCIATIAGAGLFVLTLPFTVPTRSVEKAADRLVKAPFNYTFSRPFPDKNL
jgi:hypothetical protein